MQHSQPFSSEVSHDDRGLSVPVADVQPMTASMLGKLFGIPLVIISIVVGGSVCVVLLFGAPATPQRRSMESLLHALEASSGERSMGALFPRDKQCWQAGLELSMRLEKQEFAGADLESLAGRLGALVKADLNNKKGLPSGRGVPGLTGPNRLGFLIRALGLTKRVTAIDPLVEVVRSHREPFVEVAMQQLGEFAAMPESSRAIPPILEAMAQSSRVETRLTACTVLSILASESDKRVMDALAEMAGSEEGEVAWSAALGLARLGSASGKSTLLDLLDRSFWEQGDRYRVTDDQGRLRRYPMPPQRVERFLVAAIEAASHLDDVEIRRAIASLVSDPSPLVRSRAAGAAKNRG